jgi:tRNA(fMet)-specific endonuclease VapC
MDKALLDTDTFSQVLRRYSPAIVFRTAAYLTEFDRLTISAITVTEIVKGWQKRQREDRVDRFISDLDTVEILYLSLESHITIGRILADLERTGQPIGFADTAIAAIALQNNLTLITGNLNHYQRIVNLGYPLNLETWKT